MLKEKINIKIRPFSLNDAQAAVDLFNAHSQALFGWDEVELGEMINDWTSPGLNIEETIRVIEDDHGRMIGYMEVWDTSKPHVIKYVWGVLHPDAWDADLYYDMLAWTEDCARQRIDLAPEGSRIIMKTSVPNQDQSRKAVLEAYGFDLVRHFYRMQIDLDGTPTIPRSPEGIIIKPIDMNLELQDAILTMDEAFEDHWGYVKQPAEDLMAQWDHFIKNDPDFDPSLWFIAKEGDQIVGNCRCHAHVVEDPNMGWVAQLAVRKPWRKRGLGKAMLLTAFNAFYQRGKQRVGLGVDATNLTNATRLYEKAGMHVSLQYDTYEKELRPGEDLTTTG
jgi:ribosomal protein S18 acetylase RimI-like enzyme